MVKINKNLMRVLQVNQQVKSVIPNCETCGGPHSYNDCPATVGQTQNVYAMGAYQGGNSYQPQVAKMFLGKYFPPSMVTKLRNEIINFRQRPDETLFEAWERYKDTSAQRGESSSSITSSSDPEIVALKAKMVKINKNLMRVLQVNQQVKSVIPNCETCGGPHSYNDCPATVGQTQNVYA
nr:reverse transcriptase domain-containing protein [Tanacetum cinerariifolium]